MRSSPQARPVIRATGPSRCESTSAPRRGRPASSPRRVRRSSRAARSSTLVLLTPIVVGAQAAHGAGQKNTLGRSAGRLVDWVRIATLRSATPLCARRSSSFSAHVDARIVSGSKLHNFQRRSALGPARLDVSRVLRDQLHRAAISEQHEPVHDLRPVVAGDLGSQNRCSVWRIDSSRPRTVAPNSTVLKSASCRMRK
jgi:hypothetical protein